MADENLKKEMEETVEDQADGTTEEAVEDTAEETAESANETPESDESDEEADKDDADKDSRHGKEVKKGFFCKKKEKKDNKDVQNEELTDRLKRQMAEFDNFRKRTEKEKSAMFEVGAKSVIEKMLPVVDNFERGLAAVPDDKKDDPFVEGMEKIYKQLIGTLEELEVKAIEAVGQEFDPNFHNAVMHIEDEELGDNIVAEEFQKGYTYRENVVRHSMVKVAN